MKAKTARFYGWSDDTMNEMSLDTFYKYWLAITPLEAQELLMNMKVSAYPHMKKEGQRKFFNEIRRMTSKFIDKTGGKVKSFGEVMSSLTGKLKNG